MQSSEDVLDSDIQRAIGAAFTAQIAPEEAEHYDELIAEAPPTKSPREDEELAFGVNVETIGVAAVAFFTLAKPLLDFIWANSKDAAGQLIKDASESVRKAFKRRLHEWATSGMKAPIGGLSPDAVDRAALDISRQAEGLGLDESQRSALTEVINRSLRT